MQDKKLGRSVLYNRSHAIEPSIIKVNKYPSPAERHIGPSSSARADDDLRPTRRSGRRSEAAASGPKYSGEGDQPFRLIVISEYAYPSDQHASVIARPIPQPPRSPARPCRRPAPLSFPLRAPPGALTRTSDPQKRLLPRHKGFHVDRCRLDLPLAHGVHPRQGSGDCDITRVR
jgi:hypothetical protein